MKLNLIPFVFGLLGPVAPLGSHPVIVRYEPEVVQLKGTIHERTYPGAPNYRSVRKGDRPERYWILSLANAIEVKPADEDDFNEAESAVSELQLVFTGKSRGNYGKYRHLIGQPVQITGCLHHQITVHHKTRVLIEVIEIATGTAR